MEQYISKATVVAEIERNLHICAIMISQHQDENCVELYKQKAEVYKGMRSFLDTLETKKVDLDRETTHYLLYEHRSPLNEIMHKADLKSEMQYHKDIENAFKSGFELCLKAQTKNIWHDASEELPVMHRRVLLYTEEGTVMQGRYDGGAWVLSMWFPKFPKILKWCYLSDIIPTN